jgi:hypothetical protein
MTSFQLSTLCHKIEKVGFEVLREVVRKCSIFRDITPCSLLKATCFHAGFFLGFFYDPEGGGDMFF